MKLSIVTLVLSLGAQILLVEAGEKTCFSSRSELIDAVDTYLASEENRSSDGELALKYGYPIGDWCVKEISDFSYLFSKYRTNTEDEEVYARFEEFDEDLSNWDMSAATDLSHMFEGKVMIAKVISSVVTTDIS